MNCKFTKPLSITPPIGWVYVETTTAFQIPWGDGTLSKAILALVKHRRGNGLPRADAVQAQDDIIQFTCQQLVLMGRSKGWCSCGTLTANQIVRTTKAAGGCAVCGGKKKTRKGLIR